MMSCCDIETPQSIMTEDNVDVFDGTHILEALAEDDHLDACRTALWSAYRYRGIGHLDRDYWIQCMKDRVSLILPKYSEAFAVYDAYLESEYTDLAEGVTERTVHEGKRRTVAADENLPSTGTAGSYYSGRSTTETGHAGSTDNDTEKVKQYAGLPQYTLKQALQNVTDPYSMFAREFSNMFYYGL